MAHDHRADFSDQDLVAAREKDADVKVEEEVLARVSHPSFWNKLIDSGVMDSKERGLVNDWLNFNQKVGGHEDLVDIVKSRGHELAKLFIKLLRAGDPEGIMTDFVLAAMERLFRMDEENARFFRKLAMDAWNDAMPQRKQDSNKINYNRALAQAQAEAAAELISKDHPQDLPQRKMEKQPVVPIEQLGPLSDGRVFGVFLDLLKQDASGYEVRKATRVLCVLLMRDIPSEQPAHRHFFRWLGERLTTASGQTQIICLNALKDMLKNKDLHSAFEQEQVMHDLMKILDQDTQNMQPLYLVVFSLWLLSYNPAMCHLLHDHGVVAKLVGIIRGVVREKVVRICFAVLANIMGQGSFTEEMIGVDLPRIVASIQARRWKDKELIDDIAKVEATLSKRIQELSSFEIYVSELKAGFLRKSPVHNERFWRENAIRFEDHKYELIKAIVKQLTLTNSNDSVEMACYDLGEFARFHPEGKKVISKLEGKTKLMGLMSSKDPAISKAALLAIQKLMVQKWDQMISSTKDLKESSSTSPRN